MLFNAQNSDYLKKITEGSLLLLIFFILSFFTGPIIFVRIRDCKAKLHSGLGSDYPTMTENNKI